MKKAFVNSLPKAGTNMLGKCLELFGYRLAGGLASSEVLGNKWKAKLKRLLYIPMRQGYLIGVDSPVEVSRRVIDRKLAAVNDGEFLYGHLGYTVDLMEKLKRDNFSLLLMLRDPRAVLNSFVHYLTVNRKHFLFDAFQAMPLEEKYLSALHGVWTPRGALQPLRVRCQALDSWVKEPGTALVHFEDLVGEKGGSSQERQIETLQKIAATLEINNPNFAKVSEDLFGPGRATFRKGMVDSWKEEMPKSVIPDVVQEMSIILDSWGYEK